MNLETTSIQVPESNAKRQRTSGSHSIGGRRTTKITRACDACRSKKARCSGTKPCTSCSKKNLSCSYDNQYMRGRPPTPPALTPNAGESSGSPTVTLIFAPSHESTTPLPIPHFNSSSRHSPELESTEIQGQYVDPTSGLSFLERARNRFSARRTPSGNNTQDDIRSFRQQPIMTAGDKPLLSPDTEPFIAVKLPDGEEATELLNLYFDVCVATYKPLHRPTVDAWYLTASHYANLGEPLTTGLGHAKVSILFSVFAVAIYHRQKSGSSSLKESDALFAESRRLTEQETGLPRLDSAQSRLIQVFYCLMTCRMNQAWFIFGTVLQIISSLGLHRRDRRARQEQDYIYKQSRKRTFWTAYILDKYLGVVMGRPQHFHDDDIDQDMPHCVNDTAMKPTGPVTNNSEDQEDCLIEAFVHNAKLGRLVGVMSRQLYPTRPLSDSSRLETTRRLQHELDLWHAALPPFLKTVKPSSLIRSLQRQSVAIRLAHCHAVMHLHRPYILRASDINSQSSIRHSVTAALTALRLVDNLATNAPLFGAFWWTHYVTFCALTVTYVWEIQKPQVDCGVDAEQLLDVAARCKEHLAKATASNSPSRRYSIILEELRAEADAHRVNNRTNTSDGDAAAGFAHLEPRVGGDAIFEGNPFEDWQITDWLDLDALAYGYPVGSSPDLNWL